MYLLYLDESGSQDSQHFVVGGLAVHEQDAPDIAEAVNSILRTFSPLFEHEELHTQHIRAGKGPWRRIPRPEREQLLDEIASFLVSGSWGLGRKIRMFAVVMHKESFPRLDPHERAYEEFFARGNAIGWPNDLLGRASSLPRNRGQEPPRDDTPAAHEGLAHTRRFDRRPNSANGWIR